MMANSAYAPNPLSSPALMVLASTAEATRDPAGRLAQPFPGQHTDKDIGLYNSPSFPMYRPRRPGDPFPGSIYSPMPPFVHPSMERGFVNTGSNSAFRPVTSSDNSSSDNHMPYHSAFAPAKRVKLDDSHSTITSEDTDSLDRGGSPLMKEERPSSLSSGGCDSELGAEPGEHEDGSSMEEGRSLRKQRKRSIPDGQTPHCPICGVTLRMGEMDAHFNMELEKLDKISRNGRKSSSRDSTPQARKPSPSTSHRAGSDSPGPDAMITARYDTYMRIKANRQTRLQARSRTRKRKPDETSCPVCEDRLSGTPEELNEHVEQCLKRKGGGDSDEDDTVDIEGDEEYEEYEWAGQTRVRATTMLPGGLAASGFLMSHKTGDEDGVLNVDEDDSEQYGASVYTEADVIPCDNSDDYMSNDRLSLQDRLLYEETAPAPVDRRRNDEQASGSGVSSSSAHTPLSTKVIDSLKEKIRDLEKDKLNKNKCLICRENYRTPLTSIQCWHVHCEGCWLHTLGAKKLCPQCNMITSPSDLRRIYL